MVRVRSRQADAEADFAVHLAWLPAVEGHRHVDEVDGNLFRKADGSGVVHMREEEACGGAGGAGVQRRYACNSAASNTPADRSAVMSRVLTLNGRGTAGDGSHLGECDLCVGSPQIAGPWRGEGLGLDVQTTAPGAL